MGGGGVGGKKSQYGFVQCVGECIVSPFTFDPAHQPMMFFPKKTTAKIIFSCTSPHIFSGRKGAPQKGKKWRSQMMLSTRTTTHQVTEK